MHEILKIMWSWDLTCIVESGSINLEILIKRRLLIATDIWRVWDWSGTSASNLLEIRSLNIIKPSTFYKPLITGEDMWIQFNSAGRYKANLVSQQLFQACIELF